ncbi:hypothetical protein VOLCADRAFT_89276 [Volvox carteri f. nagariensis]|uniref:RAP domain-containing protein n=1 Tax=Volvox carteri f. nagariensis TaxID=3068 RepID=D8TRA3_VOLCA|nr:uncharacterized protein VOLCADRAFT_89276 [Volvox carteri f. nagariensis]EFJ49960.1 hypothetical protein VOLCADRAFT_89276 [Volvox carteri f. nagariensis]|eukprot:XP_002949025.1 hypothetical protein VOLCADRAFT_89276 [Volvox carteri f. nagariensis]
MNLLACGQPLTGPTYPRFPSSRPWPGLGFILSPAAGHRLPPYTATITCMATRRRMIIKRRTPPASQRKKRRYMDESHSLGLDPQSPRFSGRLTTEVNSANGPLQLLRLVQEYGLYFSGTQVTMALARLAAFATFQQMSAEQLAAQTRTTRRCILLFRQKLRDCDLISYARASYSLGRLGVYDEDLMAEVTEEVYDKLNLLSPDGLAALLAGMAALGHRPADRWLDRFALEVYTRFGRFNGQELANLLYGMARLRYNPSAAWTERGRELAVLLWSLSRMMRREDVGAATTAAATVALIDGSRAEGGAGARVPDGGGVAAGPVATMVLAAAPAVAVVLDREFLDAWFRCSARRIGSASAASLVLALQALAALQITQLPSKYMNAVLVQLRLAMPGAQTSGATNQRGGAAEGTLSSTEMVSALLSLVALRIRPGPDWMESCLTGVELSLLELQGPTLCDLAWALARLQYQPSPEWTDAFALRCQAIHASLSQQQLNLLAWAFRQLDLSLPDIL